MKKRNKPFNSFRFFAIAQKYVKFNGPQGQLFDHYDNHENLIMQCDKMAYRSKETDKMHSTRIVTEYKVKTRYREDLSLQDRLLFLKSNTNQYPQSAILKIKAMLDRTGRKEYIELICSSGEYAGQVTFQPAQDNILIIQDSEKPNYLQTLNQWTYDNIADILMAIKPPGAVANMAVKKVTNKLLLTDNRPLFVTPDTINSLTGTLHSNNQAYQFIQTATAKPMKIWTSPANMPVNKNDLLQFVVGD